MLGVGDDPITVTGHVERCPRNHPTYGVDAGLWCGRVEFSVEKASNELGEADTEVRSPLLGSGVHLVRQRDDSSHRVIS